MKINMPVTHKEVELKDTSSIVSKTDLKGLITYVNRDFLEISGFTEQELIGKNHNIVRHPDMPPAAFEDLWNTVKASKPWSGLVKNRCKNGDHYWVEANVAPIRENGQIVGYMSVRSKVTRKQIENIEPVYRRMLAGEVVRVGIATKFVSAVSNMPMFLKVFVAMLLPIGAILGSAFLINIEIVNALTMAGIGFVVALLVSFSLSRTIVLPIQRATNSLNAIASGELQLKIDTKSNDEAGKMIQALKSMQIKMGFDLNDSRKIAEEAMRLQVGLDNSVAGVTFSDSQNILQYINKAGKGLWQAMSVGVLKQYKDFSANEMIGKRIDQFFESEEVRAVFSEKLNEPKTINIAMYGHQLELTIVPVNSNRGEYLGRMIQWVDRTAEVLAEKEVARLVDEAVAGKLSERVNLSILPSGFILDTGKGINHILDAVIGPLNMAAGYVENFAKGTIPAKITDSYNGDFNIIKNNLNACIDALSLLVTDANMLAQAAQDNKMDTRADASKHWGDYRKVVEGVNCTLDTVMQKNAADATEKAKEAQVLADAVEETQGIIEGAKAGDLTSRVPLHGKTGAIASLCDGVNTLMDKMTEVIIQVREAGETINTAAGEISSGNTDLSSRTEQQASSLEETAASMEELASTVKQNAENAKQANQLAVAASGVAVKGGEVVSGVVSTMSAINESARKIEDIISVIDGIAFQTNILALNAAVEAARAGEQGRGFAVVAGEVRNLAQRSASAAKEIKELITDSVAKTTEGTKQVENAGKTMDEVVTSVKRVADIISEIAAASVEQSVGIDQVNTAVTSMDEVTQQNAALVEQAAAAAESLVDQANALTDVISVFKLEGVGNQDKRASSSPMRHPGGNLSSKAAKLEPVKPLKLSAKAGSNDGDWEEF
ncbi:MAG: methyl-accepting chemotaxis protein [Methylotenera sp.]|nr:methyl-accepting chemotaxis protein [Methylotenera sp.]